MISPKQVFRTLQRRTLSIYPVIVCLLSFLIGVSPGYATYTESMSWQLDGKLATGSKVQGAGLGVSSEYLYNGRGQMLNEWSAFSDSNTRNWTYGFDPDYGFGGTGLGVRLAAKRQVTMSGPGDWEEGSFYAFNTDAFWRGTAEGEITPANNLNIWNSDYDGMGNQVHRGVMAPTYKDQTLTWDGLGRLVLVSQRDGANTGFDFTSLYDGLGRRIRTTEQAVTAGNATGTPRVIESYFDPEVEFLEVGLSVDGQRIWKVYGGDFESGGYGVSQGTGGLLATVEEASSEVTPLIADHFGHVQGRVSGGVVQWNGAELNSYGQEATGTVPALTSASLLPQTLTWRGQRADPTGLINLGMRPYDPESGRFMAADPLGHSGSFSLYDYADGDPINNIDPDGRVAKGFLSGQSYNAGSMFGKNLGDSLPLFSGGTRQAFSYAANLDYHDGSHFNALNATYNPVYAASTKGYEAYTGLGVSYSNSGQSLSWAERAVSGVEASAAAVNSVAIAYVGARGSSVGSSRFVNAISNRSSLPAGNSIITRSGGYATQLEFDFVNNLSSPVSGKPRINSALKIDGQHGFPDLVDDYASGAIHTTIPTKGPGGKIVGGSDLFQLRGSWRGESGIFEWILDASGKITHRRFIPGKGITRTPN